MSRSFKIIALAFLLSAITGVSKAADPTHHFKLTKPAKVTAGDTAALTITAHRKDGSLIGDAANSITLTITTRDGSEEHKLDLVGGKASINIKFAQSGSHLIWIQDNADPKLKLSESVKVNYKVEVLK
jgi:hypothetical protein